MLPRTPLRSPTHAALADVAIKATKRSERDFIVIYDASEPRVKNETMYGRSISRACVRNKVYLQKVSEVER